MAQCPACQLAFREPPPYDDFLTHYEAAYCDVAASAHVDRGRRHIFTELLAELGPGRGRRLLDVGCATGGFMSLARAHGWAPMGVEATCGGREAVRRLGLRADADTRSYADASVDVVTLWNVVEFFPAPLEQMLDLFRILVPGGLLFARTPNAAYQLTAYRASQRLRWPSPLARLAKESYHFNPLIWNGRSLRALLERSGFEGVDVRNGTTSWGDPYRHRGDARQWLIHLLKRAFAEATGAACLLSGGRVLLGSSLVALARKPARQPMRDPGVTEESGRRSTTSPASS